MFSSLFSITALNIYSAACCCHSSQDCTNWFSPHWFYAEKVRQVIIKVWCGSFYRRTFWSFGLRVKIIVIKLQRHETGKCPVLIIVVPGTHCADWLNLCWGVWGTACKYKECQEKIVIFFSLKKIIDHVVEGLEGGGNSSGNEDEDGISRGWLN